MAESAAQDSEQADFGDVGIDVECYNIFQERVSSAETIKPAKLRSDDKWTIGVFSALILESSVKSSLLATLTHSQNP